MTDNQSGVMWQDWTSRNLGDWVNTLENKFFGLLF